MEENHREPEAAPKTGESWESEMDGFKQKIELLEGKSDDASLDIGDILIQAKLVYEPHGNWTRWIEQNIPFSVRQAQRRIKAAKFRSEHATLVSQYDLTSTKLYLLARLPTEDIESFLENPHDVRRNGEKKTVGEMSKKELEYAVRSYLRGESKSSNAPLPTDTSQGDEDGKSSFESDFESLKQAMEKAIASAMAYDENNRDSLISTLEKFCKVSMYTLSLQEG